MLVGDTGIESVCARDAGIWVGSRRGPSAVVDAGWPELTRSGRLEINVDPEGLTRRPGTQDSTSKHNTCHYGLLSTRLMPGHFRARLSALDPHSPTHCRPPFRRNTTDPNMAGYLYSSCVFAIALCRNRLFRSSTLLGPGFDCAALRVSR
jgi:hypothetical protein